MSQQGIWLRFPSSEVFEDLHRRPAAAEGEDGIAEVPAQFADGVLILQAGLLEGAEGIGAEHGCGNSPTSR